MFTRMETSGGRYCRHCGAKNKPHDQFCKDCGKEKPKNQQFISDC